MEVIETDAFLAWALSATSSCWALSLMHRAEAVLGFGAFELWT